MFFDFVNFHKEFIKGLNKIVALFNSILKLTTLSASTKLGYIQVNENKADINRSAIVINSKINNRFVNLLNNMKKISFKIGFLLLKLV